MNRYHRKILEQLGDGYGIDNERHGHALVMFQGRPLRMPGGMPVLISGSPSDQRTMQNDLCRIRRASIR